ncbi:MAG: MmcQ/YjbR family DNA-binding protein [Vicinamibacterales bacterium]
MGPHEFRRMALAMEGAVEGAHMGHPDFRVSDRIFATLHSDERSGMVALTPDQQQRFIGDDPDTFTPENGAWGRAGYTRVRLAAADGEAVGEALTLAWQNAINKGNAKRAKPRRPSSPARRQARR